MKDLSEAVRKAVEEELDGTTIFEVVYVVASEGKDGNVVLTTGSCYESNNEARKIMINNALERIG